MFNRFHQLSRFFLLFNKLHSNISLLIGSYGIFFLTFMVLSTHWVFNAHLDSIYTASLPPAWWSHGDINHLFGTNQSGQDIFYYLLISYRSTISMTIKATLYVILTGAILNYILFFADRLRPLLLLCLRLLNTIPILLSVITMSLLFKQSTTTMLIVVGIAHLPRFVYNIHNEILKENNKTYIDAYRLDGLTPLTIFRNCIIPNIVAVYLTEIVTLVGHNMLVITSLTFLGFNRDLSHPNLGMMMFQMKEIIASNYWAFLSPGLAVALTITLVYLLNFGLFRQQTRG